MRRLFGVSESRLRDPAAAAGEADAEIGVLGDVPFVPSACADERVDAEMIGGAAERDRQVEGGQTRIDEIEKDRVLDGEHAPTARNSFAFLTVSRA